MFMSVALFNPPPTSVLTKRILKRQNGVEDLSLLIINNTNKSYFSRFLFIHFYPCISYQYYFIHWCILLCKYHVKLLKLINLIMSFSLLYIIKIKYKIKILYYRNEVN